MRIAFVQYGDYSEAFVRFKQGGDEYYYAQRYSVDFVEQISQATEMTIICHINSKESNHVVLTDRLHSIGFPPSGRKVDQSSVIRTLKEWQITHVILTTPQCGILGWCIRHQVHALPLFADSWGKTGLRGGLSRLLLSRRLQSKWISIVCNHNLPASLSLANIGVPANKIIPWDWPHELNPSNYAVKSMPQVKPSVVYVGQLTKIKGVEDCILAAQVMRTRGCPISLSLIGSGNYEEQAQELIQKLGLQDSVKALGKLPRAKVLECLQEATVSLVPSHHEYPEGLPMTIYEALATRTPIVLSDHPMFRMFFSHSKAAWICQAQNPESMANALDEILSDPKRYQAASEATAHCWQKICGPLSWGKIIQGWLLDPQGSNATFAASNLEARMSAISNG